jgi:signal transduction histidine kinase/CheY-like chemotaxis protein
MSVSAPAFQDTLQDLRSAMLRRLTFVMFVFAASVAYLTLLAKVFPLELFLLAAGVTGAIALLRHYLLLHLNVTRYGLLLVVHVGLFGAMYLHEAPWLPFGGLVLVLISGMISSFAHWVSAGLILTAAGVLSPLHPYPLPELGVLLLLMAVIMQTSISSLYVALTWYSVTQKRVDELLHEARQRRAELAQNVKSLEIAYQNLNAVQQQLVYAREQADEARRMKERFAANISHELRTPLNLILGFSEIMVMTPEVYGDLRLPSKLTHDLYQIYSNSRHLLAMIDDVLDLSQIELSRFALNLEPTDPAWFIEDSRAIFENIFRDSPLQFHIQLAPHLPTLDIDRTRIRQVLLNLLGNARRFTEQGSVQLIVEKTAYEVLFIVQDSGRGIAPDKLELIFEEFYQVDYSLSRSHGGAGLGLAISKRFVERHGGYITVASQEKQGSTFTFAIPLQPKTPTFTDFAIPLPTTTQRGYVVVLDRDPTVAFSIRRYLPHYQVLGVTQVNELPEILHQYRPSVVIDNMNAATEYPFPDSLLYIQCALPSTTALLDQLGIQAYLPKPVMIHDLVALIRQLPQVRRILIVDDDLGFVQLVQRALETQPETYTIQRAYDTQRALDLLHETRPDVLLLDLVMPNMDGLVLLETLRADPDYAQLPVILLTATRHLPDTRQTAPRLLIEQTSDAPLLPLRWLQAILESVHSA